MMSSSSSSFSLSLSSPFGFSPSSFFPSLPLSSRSTAWTESPLVPVGEESERDAIASWLCFGEDDHVLDVCAGSGAFTLALAKQGSRVTGIDRSRRYMDFATAEAARMRIGNRCTFLCSSLEVEHPLPIYDGVTSYLGLSELLKTKSLTSVLRAMHRRVRTGGRVILIEQFPDDATTQQHRRGMEANVSMGHAYVSVDALLASARDVGLHFRRSLRIATTRNIVSRDREASSPQVEAILRVVELTKQSSTSPKPLHRSWPPPPSPKASIAHASL